MNLTRETYQCNKIKGAFGHVFQMNKNIANNDKELSFFINKTTYINYDAIFYSLGTDRHWDNAFNLQDFDILKTIKTPERLQFFINKLKIFT